jgi:hypothetical protein
MIRLLTELRLAAAVIALGLMPGTAAAGEPVAIIEALTAENTGLRFMDYVEEGRVIDLGPGGTMTLGYLATCWQEEVRGGRITIGREQSVVERGAIERRRVDCDGGAIKLTTGIADKSGVMVFRRPAGSTLTVYGTSPIVRFNGTAAPVAIERLDQPGERHVFPAGGRFVDLADSGTVLTRGGVYRATAGQVAVVFKVDHLAATGRSPAVGRLLPLDLAGP